MKTQYGGETVERGGFYLSFHRKELLSLEASQKLPGTDQHKFYKVPLGAMLILGPIVGLFYVMFLPFISLAMVGWLLFRRVKTSFRKATTIAAHSHQIHPEPRKMSATRVSNPEAKKLIIPPTEGRSESRHTAN